MSAALPALQRSDLDPDPVTQFAAWFAAARELGPPQPEAAALATADAGGAPSARMVLVKAAGPEGMTFFTNYASRKGHDLEANPRAALLFFWDPPGRQVRIEGPVAQTSRADSEAYAHSRHRLSQLSALASPQSRPVSDRAELEATVARLDARHAGSEIPVSEHWGGFRLVPERFEFWQNGRHRLHDRFLYTRGADGAWQIERLAP